MHWNVPVCPGIVVVTELQRYPRKKILCFFLAAGELPELRRMLPFILAWGRDQQHCDRAVIIGREMRVQVAKSMAEYVASSIRREAAKAWQNAYGVSPRTFHADFGTGAAIGVKHQVREIMDARKRGELGAERISASQALVVVGQHQQALTEADQWMREKNPNIAGAYKAKQRELTQATRAGYAYGTKVSLNNQLGGGAKRAAIR